MSGGTNVGWTNVGGTCVGGAKFVPPKFHYDILNTKCYFREQLQFTWSLDSSLRNRVLTVLTYKSQMYC